MGDWSDGEAVPNFSEQSSSAVAGRCSLVAPTVLSTVLGVGEPVDDIVTVVPLTLASGLGDRPRGPVKLAVGFGAEVSTLPVATTLTASMCASPEIPVLMVVLIRGPRRAAGIRLTCGSGVRAGLRSALTVRSVRIAAWLSEQLRWKF